MRAALRTFGSRYASKFLLRLNATSRRYSRSTILSMRLLTTETLTSPLATSNPPSNNRVTHEVCLHTVSTSDTAPSRGWSGNGVDERTGPDDCRSGRRSRHVGRLWSVDAGRQRSTSCRHSAAHSHGPPQTRDGGALNGHVVERRRGGDDLG